MKKAPLAMAAVSLLALTSCAGDNDPLSDNDSAEDDANDTSVDNGELVIGSQQYYSNTIIAEIYAQVLEQEGFDVDRQFEIGQREVYIPELESGAIDVFPEYTGNLLQYLNDDHDASDPEAIQEALGEELPDDLDVLEAAEANDQDSYVVTQEFASEHDLGTVADLAEVGEDLSIAANSEFETRPYGINGLSETYGVDLTLVPVEDSGGPLTLNALLSGDVEVANIYSADPAIEENDLFILEDTENLVLPQNLVPVVSQNVDEEARSDISSIQALLTQEALLEINAYSQDEQATPADVAQWWLEGQGLLN